MASASVEQSMTPQAVEVAQVKAAFPGRCRVMKDMGVFPHVVTLQPQDMDLTLKFQLPDSYPASAPAMVVRSESLTEEKTEELRALLTTEAAAMLHKPMMQALVSSTETWLRAQGIQRGKTVNAKAEVFLTGEKKKARKPKKGKKKAKEEEEEDTKKAPMKTADDVIKRIMWDERLDKDNFLVGYLDRFKGVMEKYFSAFSWEDIASVDYDVLAIPRHRIQYFKYKREKIWDKPTRTDNVFGSTGSGKTIYDVISNYVEPAQEGAAGTSTLSGSGAQRNEDDESYSDNSNDSDDDDDDDDGITVTINSSVNTVPCHDDAEEHKDLNPHWEDKQRPNYFLALRITSPEVRQAVEQIQDYILDNEPLYAPCCIPAPALHITLCTLGLDTAEQVAHARDVLTRLQPELIPSRPSDPLHLQGVSNFFSRVVYAQVKPHPQLMAFVEHLKLLVREAGVEIRDNHDFVPHMTIMKVTRPVARQKGSKTVDPWLYHNFTDMDFGEQKVDAVYLCSMGDERQDDGFYVCPAQIHF